MNKTNKRVKVALIDDSEYFRRGLSILMEKFRFEVSFEAENGEQCIEKLTELTELPDVCILDIFMPVMNGFETATQIKAAWPAVKIIACSTIKERGVVDEIIAAGADVFLMKNSDAKEFKKAILDLTAANDS